MTKDRDAYFEDKILKEQDNPRWDLPKDLREKLEKALTQARKENVIPFCEQDHGVMELHISKKGTLYWRCSFPGCEQRAWYKNLSSHLCPQCNKKMEMVPSRKVTGGYFLKCDSSREHDPVGELVLFRDRVTNQWAGALRAPVKKEPEKKSEIQSDIRQSILNFFQQLSVEFPTGLSRDTVYEQIQQKLFPETSKNELELLIEKLIQEGFIRYLPSKDVFAVIKLIPGKNYASESP